jgi:signal transduction histidine kinase
LELLSAFARQAAAAITNACLYDQVNQNLSSRIVDLETLAQIDQQLNTDLDFDHVVETTYHWALQGTSADDGWLALCEPTEPGSTEPKLKIVAGRDKGQILNRSDPMAVHFLEKRSALEDKARSDQPKEANAHTFPTTENNPAQLVIPILIAGRFIGMLSLERPTDFPESASQFLNWLVTHAGIAIENARLYQAVQIANETKSKFVSLVVHELRIPMTSIKGYTDLLRQGAAGPVTEMQQNFLNIIRNNVDRMAALVSDLSDISRIESGRLKLEPVLTMLKSHVDEVVRGLEHEIKEKQQTLEIDILDNLPPIFADPSRVVQILYNLVNNAWKYTPDEGKIIIRVFILDDMVQIEVEDSGIGINDEEQKNLFTQFFRS